MLPLLRLQQVGQAPPHADGVPLQVLPRHDVQDGESDGARDRVPAKLIWTSAEGRVRAEPGPMWAEPGPMWAESAPAWAVLVLPC